MRVLCENASERGARERCKLDVLCMQEAVARAWRWAVPQPAKAGVPWVAPASAA